MERYRCPECGEGEMVSAVVPEHKTKLGGRPVKVADAVVARCTRCGKTHVTAKELKRWERIQREQTQKSGFVPSGSEVRVLRERLGLSASNLAVLLGVTRQTVYVWESEDMGPMPIGPAALLLKLLEAEAGRDSAELYSKLRDLAIARSAAVAEDLPGKTAAHKVDSQVGLKRAVAEWQPTGV
ncbi:MAG: type II TA system antitoxin MqsA family protein [Planctomycetota bacterium]